MHCSQKVLLWSTMITFQNFHIMSFFTCRYIFSHKYIFTCCYPAGKYWSLELPKESHPTSLKYIIWPASGRYHLNKLRSDVPRTFQNNLMVMYFGRHSQVFSVHSEDILGTWWGRLLDVPKFNFTFFSKLIVILRGVFRTKPSI